MKRDRDKLWAWRARSRRLNPINHKRRAEQMARAFGPQAELCRTLPCCVCGRRPSDPHHLRSRGAGGTDRHCVPLCREHHDEIHRLGRDSFMTRHRVDLWEVAKALERRTGRDETTG